AQTFVELEGGGKAAFTRMLRENLYAAYTWRVRHFKDGETNETTISFTPDGRPYGFQEKLKEDAPGPALDAAAARRIAEQQATSRWNVPLSVFTLVEQGQERRPAGRVDHTFTYERTGETLNEGRYRLRLEVAGDRLTGVTHFIKIPEAFTRRYAKMRSANELIGIGSVVGMVLLYVIGGIGVGLFFMLRRRWILWRHAAVWGVVVGGLQTLAQINEFPLVWMTYDTAIPRATFLAQQAALMAAGFVGFSVFFALSFIAAETLSRRAFGHHPQLWRAWSPQAGASVQILGRTVGGYLLVSIFFAYDVALYVVMTRVFGWWSPAEALVHPDVLATYAPWLSAIANSFQAGFWEESMFRAIPIAGAALIGERIGQRRLCIVLAFVVQAIVFGAGHAPYPNQPAYSRPVELILPSIGFGLLYLNFGLIPGIVLHFTFDVVWFAIPVFMAKAPGIWFQQFMIVALTLVPLWVVLWRRLQAGRWLELAPEYRNAAWTPPPAREPIAEPVAVANDTLTARARTGWIAAGGISLAALAAAAFMFRGPNPFGLLPVSRSQAESLARTTLQQRGVTLAPKWRVLAVPDDGSGGPHQFVYETAGERRWRELLGVYLPKPRWRVRVATFEGDANETAEEWHLYVAANGEVRNIQHVLPEARPGASLDEGDARERALAAITDRFGLVPSQLKEISAKPQKQKARTDWTFTFTDTTIPPLPTGEPRIDAVLGGDEVTAVSRYIHVPEEWERQQRAGSTRNFIIQIAESIVFGGLLLGCAIAGIIAWSRRRYAPRLFLYAAVIVLLLSATSILNNLPKVIAALPTAAPLQLQLIGLVAVSAVGLTVAAALVGLAIGAVPSQLTGLGRVDERDAAWLAIAAGCVGAALAAAAAAVR
ncbi:MAG TPA: CPBP family intramembrane glutamic endopeptidase, partial [Vicinamibacterales bacterium]